MIISLVYMGQIKNKRLTSFYHILRLSNHLNIKIYYLTMKVVLVV